MVETTDVNIINDHKIIKELDNLGNSLDSISKHMVQGNDSLSSLLASIHAQMGEVSETIEKCNESICLINVDNSNWFLDNLLPTLIGAALSFAIAWWIFVKGVKREMVLQKQEIENEQEKEKNKREQDIQDINNQRRYDREEDERRKKEADILEKQKRLAYLKHTHISISVYVDALGEAVDKLVGYIEDFVNNSPSNKSFQLDRFELTLLSVESLKSFSISELSSVYITNRDGDLQKKSICVYNVQQQIDYLGSVTTLMMDYYSQNQNYGIQLLNQWNVYMKSIEDANSYWVTKGDKDPVGAQFCYYVEPFLNKGINPKKWDAGEWIDNVISPLHSWLAISSSLAHNTSYMAYENSLRSLITLNEQRVELIKGVAKMFDDYSKCIRKSYKVLRENIDELNSNDFVDINDIE